MQNVSETVKKLYKTQNSSEVNKNYKIVIDETINLENSDIVYGSFKLNQVICSANTLTFGESNAAMIQFQCASDVGNIKGKEMNVSQEINGNIVSIGKYIIDSCEITENRRYRTIIGYDNIYKFRKDVSSSWYEGLDFPITIKSMFQSLCEFFKVGCVEPNFVNGEMLVEKTIDADELLGITVLKSIAELNGGFFRANPSGLIEFITLDRSTVVEEFPVSAYTNLKKEDFQVKKYDRLNIRQEMGDIGVSSGTGDNAYIIEDNFLVYGKSTEQLKTTSDNLYTIISDIQYVPYTATEIGLPYLEPGDYVKYVTTTGEFCSFIFSRVLTGTQILKDTIETKGTEETEETFGLEKEIIKLKGKSNVLSRSIESTNEKITNLKTDIKENYSTTNETLTEITKVAGEIKSTVESTYTTKKEFEQLEVGGRNIVLGTEKWSGDWLEKSKAEIDGNSVSVPLMDIPKYTPVLVTPDELITIGIDISSSVDYTHNNEYGPILLDWLNNNNIRVSYTWAFQDAKITNSWKRFTMSIKVPENAEKLSIGLRSTAGYVNRFRFLKIERGNKSTDWTPAPEDVNESINNVNLNLTKKYTSLNQTIDELTATVNSNIEQIETKADNSVVTNIESRVTELQADADGFKTTVSNTYTTKMEFENLKIGATNILRNYSKYTEEFKLKIVATKDNYYEITSAGVTLEEGKQYTFSCKTDGIWGFGNESTITDTVEAYLLLNGKYDTYFRLDSNEGFTFTAPADGEYWLRVDVNKNGITHYFWNFQIEEGNKATTWAPCPTDVNGQITNILTIASQTADKFNWLVESGTSASDFTITDRLVTLTSQALNIDAITTFMNSAKDGTSTVINGSSISSGELRSVNLIYDGETLKLISGCILDLNDGSFISPNLTWDEFGNMTASNVNFKSGYIGNWHLNPETNTIYSLKNYGGTHGTDIEVGMRAAVESSTADNFLEQWTFYSGYKNPDSDILLPFFYIKADGSAYFGDSLEAYNLKCTKFLTNWEAWSNGGLFTQKLFGSTTAGTRYCFWMEPIREEQGLDTCVLFGGQQDSRTTDTNYWNSLWYVKLTGEAKFDDVYASKYNTVSDRNKKHDIQDLDEQTCIKIICLLKAVKYKYNDTQFERYHWGFIAQDVEEMLNSIGIDWRDYAVVDKSISKKEVAKTNECDVKQEVDESEYNYYLRYEAFIAPLVKTVQAQQKKLVAQQKEIDELKTLVKEILNKI